MRVCVRTLCAFSVVMVLVAAIVLLDVSAAYAGDCKRCGRNHTAAVVQNGKQAPPAPAAAAPAEPLKPAPATVEPAKATSTESPRPAPVPAEPAVTPAVKAGAPVGVIKSDEPKVSPKPAPAAEEKKAPAPTDTPGPTPEPVKKVEPPTAETAPSSVGKDESKPAAAAKPDEPKKTEKPSVVPPVVKGNVAGDSDEEMILIRPKDIAVAVQAASDEGFNAGYAEGVTKSKRYRVMTREEAIELGLKTAREVIEKRLGPKPKP